MVDPLDIDRTLLPEDPSRVPVLEPGAHVGQYRVLRLLGRGGMGEVYEVEHKVLHRRYALKLLPHDFASRQGALERFKREAQVMANLDHKNILRVDEFGEDEGRYWLRLELAKGIQEEGSVVSLQDLAEKRDGKIAPAEFTPLFRQILEGMAYAHSRGAVHRDLKPANILFSGKQAKVADFGLVRLVGEEWVRSQAEISMQRSMSLGDENTYDPNAIEGTSTRSLLGTYEYMSPEQRHREEADERSDVYTLGLMAYRLLTDRSQLGRRAASSYVPGLATAWDELIDKAVEDEPEERFAHAGEMLTALDSADQPKQTQSTKIKQPPPSTPARPVPQAKKPDTQRPPTSRLPPQEIKQPKQKRPSKTPRKQKGKKKSKLGCLGALVVAVVILAGMLLPALSQGREKARRFNCAGNLKQIGLGLRMWSADHDESFPSDLSMLIEQDYLTSFKCYTCPSTTTTPATSLEAFRSGRGHSYVYFGKGLTESGNDTNTIIAGDRMDNHNSFVNVLFADGHVKGFLTNARSYEQLAIKQGLRLPKPD